MKKRLPLFVFILTIFVLTTCKKDEEEQNVECLLEFTISYDDPKDWQVDCNNITYSNTVSNILGNPISFDYEGCGDKGHVTITRDYDQSISLITQDCN